MPTTETKIRNIAKCICGSAPHVDRDRQTGAAWIECINRACALRLTIAAGDYVTAADSWEASVSALLAKGGQR